MAFKSFSEKSKAKRGLLAFAKKLNIELSDERVSDLLQMSGDPMKWGFHEQDVTDKSIADTFNGAGIGTELQPLETKPEASESTSEEADTATDAPAPVGNMFGQLIVAGASNSNATATTRAPAAPRGAYVIEKDRPEQNGIKRPSAGGLCRAVWDAMDAIRESTGVVPVTKQVREAAKVNNWNENNAMIEFYQWRKFNGITGRAKKVEAPAAPAEAPAPQPGTTGDMDDGREQAEPVEQE